METFPLFALGLLALSLLILFILFKLLRALIRKQIDDQMKDMIPIQVIRKRVGIRIKWRKF